jgi:hypothetical protein
MPFKMIANRHVYRPEERKEYTKGESFTVQTEKERDRLLRYKRASLDETKAAPEKTVKPALKTRVMAAETQAAPATETAAPTAEPSQGQDFLGEAPSRSNRYRRSDLRSED